MDPRTIFEIIDQSNITSVDDLSSDNSPLFMYAFTSDKGPEDLRVVSANKFTKLYGNVSFKKHGQPLLQANRSVNAGARVLAQRIVDPASTLANAIVTATITVTEVQKTDAEGDLLYLTVGGVETTVSEGNTAIMINKVKLKYETSTTANADSVSAVDAQAQTLAVDDKTFPLFSIVDIGRGSSNKRFRISPDYTTSKGTNFTVYGMDVLENSGKLETIKFGLDPDLIWNMASYSMGTQVNSNSDQIRASFYETQYDAFIAKLADVLNKTTDEVKALDLLSAKDKAGLTIFADFTIDAASISLANVFGVALSSGSNGTFGDAPIDSVGYGEEVAKAFTGELSNDIFDLTQHQVAAIIDANYPAEVKRAIESFVTFREDCFYFRDLGIVNTLDGIKASHALAAGNKFSSSYHMSYDVIDPNSMKQVKVTVGYTLAKLLVEHFKNGSNRPLAGMLYGMILTDAVKGTLNYKPVVTPDVNQREILSDARVNYASYYGDDLVLETQFTSQTTHTQFSYINNVLAVQELIRDIRIRCPKIRYNFLDGDDLTAYQEDVQRILNKHTDKFKTLTFEYVADPTMVQNKIFYAAIKVSFRDYVESEYFKVYAIN